MSFASSRNSPNRAPQELVDRYLQAVRFWLPREDYQDSLLAELGEDLRSQIEQREAELGRALSEDEVSDILKRCGAPMVVASRLDPGRSLIGPALFPIYRFVLRMVLFWILVPVFLFIVGPANWASASSWPDAAVATLGGLLYGWFIAAGIITLIFAVLERMHAHAGLADKWDPRKLPPLRQPERKASLANSVCEMAFAYFGVIWLLLLPHYPWLILGPAAAFLKAAHAVHVSYAPLVALAVLALLRSTTIFVRPQWRIFPLSSLLIHEVLTFIFLTVVLNAAGTPHGSDWHPFVVLAESARTSIQYANVPVIVNLTILISVLIGWFSLGIAVIVHAWQLIQFARAKKSRSLPAASLHAR